MEELVQRVMEGPVILQAAVLTVIGLIGVFTILTVFYFCIRILTRRLRKG
jgi:hypothetical protein